MPLCILPARPSKYIGPLARFKGRYTQDTGQLPAQKARQPTEGFSLRLALNGEGKFGLKLDPGGGKRRGNLDGSSRPLTDRFLFDDDGGENGAL